MRLTGNKRDIIDSEVLNRIFWKERSIWDSNLVIFRKQGIWIDDLISSDFLIDNIYNEIKR